MIAEKNIDISFDCCHEEYAGGLLTNLHCSGGGTRDDGAQGTGLGIDKSESF